MTENAQVEQRAHELMQQFYLSADYSPQAPRHADTVEAAIKFTLQRLGQEFDAGEAVACWISPGQLAAIADPDDGAGSYLPVRKQPKGMFTTPLYRHPPPQADAEVERKPCPDLMREDHGEAVEWITANCTAIRRDNGDMDYSLGAMIAAYEAGKAAPQADADLIARARAFIAGVADRWSYPGGMAAIEKKARALDAALSQEGK